MKKQLALLSFSLFLACGGGGGSSSSQAPAPAPAPAPTASTLAYTDPTPSSSSAYVLKKNAALSTPGSHLVLELWGPSGVNGSGITLTMNADAAKATWSNVSASDAAGTLMSNGAVFQMPVSGTPILKAKATSGTLIATVAEQGTGSAKALNGALIRVALDLKSGVSQGSSISLSADLTKCRVLLSDGTIAPISTLNVGTLTAQ